MSLGDRAWATAGALYDTAKGFVDYHNPIGIAGNEQARADAAIASVERLTKNIQEKGWGVVTDVFKGLGSDSPDEYRGALGAVLGVVGTGGKPVSISSLGARLDNVLAGGAGNNIKVLPHGEMLKTPDLGQSHHLNQDAVFGGLIARNDGVAIKLEGNAFTDVGSPHYNAHRSLEGFYNQFRKGGDLYGEIPTNLQYSKALLNSLQDAGLSRPQAMEAVRFSIKQRIDVGQLGGLEIPRVPSKLGQVKPNGN
jgi:hypothetical protein